MHSFAYLLNNSANIPIRSYAHVRSLNSLTFRIKKLTVSLPPSSSLALSLCLTVLSQHQPHKAKRMRSIATIVPHTMGFVSHLHVIKIRIILSDQNIYVTLTPSGSEEAAPLVSKCS